MHYKLTPEGRYACYEHTGSHTKETEVFVTDVVALAFVRSDDCYGDWILMKHGPDTAVDAWAQTARGKYLASGLQSEARLLTVIEGRFPVDELNRIINTAGYIRNFCWQYGFFPAPAR